MRIIVDDVADIPVDLIKKHNIWVVPVNVMFGTEEFLSGVTISADEFYNKTETVTAKNFPKTSQPTPFQFEEVYKEIVAAGERDILVITVSEKLSGTYASAVSAAKEMADKANVHIFDSKTGTTAHGLMAITAARMAEAGESIEAILAKLSKMRENMVVYVALDNLEYAVKGGRVSALKSLMASVLNIKPLVQLVDGAFEEAGKVRTRKKVYKKLVDLVYAQTGDRPAQVAVVHARDMKRAQILLKEASAVLNVSESFVTDMAIPVAINLGPGALGLIAIVE